MSNIDITAYIGSGAAIHPSAEIGPGVSIGDGTVVGYETEVRAGSSVGNHSFIGSDVVIGRGVDISGGVLILNKARICPNPVRSVSTNGRTIDRYVSVGRGVLLHDEVELGEVAIVPIQGTIKHIGSLGAKNRVVTIYGSESGPRYSIGCQIGIDFSTVQKRVINADQTVEASADTYVPYLGVFNEIGSIVQSAFDREENLIKEMLAMRAEYGLGVA